MELEENVRRCRRDQLPDGSQQLGGDKREFKKVSDFVFLSWCLRYTSKRLELF